MSDMTRRATVVILADCGHCYRRGTKIVLRDKKCPVHGDKGG